MIMRQRAVLFGIVLAVVVGAVPVLSQANDDPCAFNLSQLVAGLVEAQAASSAGEPENALPVLRAAAEALTILADRCDEALNAAEMAAPESAPESTPPLESTPSDGAPAAGSLSIPGSFRSPNGELVFDYPPEWTISAFIPFTEGSGAVNLATSDAALQALNVADPVLAPGEQAVQIVTGSPDSITNAEINEGDLEALAAFFIGTFERRYDDLSAPEYTTIINRPAARILFGTDNVDGVVVIVQLDELRFVVIGGLGAKGERESLIAAIDSIAGTLQ
ncbi:MAG: hypothetical protein SF162_11960 [bacterium]|nr:hypothetical protein [bacterium]